ncbi:MAG TPA: hypothetical protein PK664_08990 [Paludibacteraceae bacterium]|jgi:hypothetical protein|nr:hypothetical protein [Paludibacteraceae bacterium]HPS11497.1 hypothetical protein [Paludibacteraceae bacterium]
MSRNKLCPQCKIRRFQVKNDAGQSVVVMVSENNEIIPIHDDESLEGFDLTVLYCLGCSWKGSVKSLI